MEYATLGRTGLRVSVAGLGCGGFSRLGQGAGASTAESVAVAQAAIDLGINFIDTARTYGTEGIVGEALRGRRDTVIVSTKSPIVKKFPASPRERFTRAELATPSDLAANIDASLKALGVDCIDLFNLHGVAADQLAHVRTLVPVLMRAREQGKIRFLGVTEQFSEDKGHAMLPALFDDDVWDVVMVGFNLLNPSARARVFPITRARNIGVQCMFAVRKALHDPATLEKCLAEAAAAGQLDRAALDPADPLGFLRAHAGSVVEAAYRFCRHEPGVDIVLTGTGNIAHLKENVAAINKGPLPAPVLARLDALFGGVDSVNGQ